MLGGVAGEDDPKLGDPDRKVIVGVARRVDECERQVAAVDREPAVANREVWRGENEVVEAARLQLLHLRPRQRPLIGGESFRASHVTDDRRRVDGLRPTEDLVPPGVVVVGVRVDDEQALGVRRPDALLGELARQCGCAEGVDDHEPALGRDDERINLVPAPKPADPRIEAEWSLGDLVRVG